MSNQQPKRSPQPFKIEKMDGMGQGIAYIQNTITFIPKSLPGETGTCMVTKKKKGVQFARIETLEKQSEQRINSECIHYSECNGCDFLHVSYEQELNFKREALSFFLQRFLSASDVIDVIPSPTRFGYRNRMQLHYDREHFGLKDTESHQIRAIPQCRLPCVELKPTIESLYLQNHWQTESKQQTSPQGHCEVYWKDQEVKITWNSAYADGGFSQVNDAANHLLQQKVEDIIQSNGIKTVIDLFSGSGNLSQSVDQPKLNRAMVDMVDSEQANYFKLNLFEEQALNRFFKKSALKHADLLIVDPPRKGFPLLSKWVNKINPHYLLYVSCNPATLSRDLNSITKKWSIESVTLLDMFPGTRHFETLVLYRLT